MKRPYLLALFLLLLIGVLALQIQQQHSIVDWLADRSRPTREDMARYQPLVDKLGPPLYSKAAEELIIRDWFNDRRDGFFLDIGANHYSINNNTYYLEKNLGWRGLAVDALTEYEKGYLKHRPATRYFTFFVSNRSDERAPFFVIKANKRLSSGLQRLAQNWEHDEIEVPTITLDDLLDHADVAQIDLLSMDIELWEPPALAGFDIERFAPELVCIEAHPQVQEAISVYFANHGYERIERYLAFDSDNWYFRPRTRSRTDAPPAAAGPGAGGREAGSGAALPRPDRRPPPGPGE